LLGRDGERNQEIGSISTSEGRCIAFPNIYQHRVSPFELIDKTKPGHRKIVALFLVDPTLGQPRPVNPNPIAPKADEEPTEDAWRARRRLTEPDDVDMDDDEGSEMQIHDESNEDGDGDEDSGEISEDNSEEHEDDSDHEDEEDEEEQQAKEYDPNAIQPKIPSTSLIPPQQLHWIRAALNENTPSRVNTFHKLPLELIDTIMGQLQSSTRNGEDPDLGALMTMDEAFKYRLELMEERTAFVTTHDDQYFVTDFNFCEH